MTVWYYKFLIAAIFTGSAIFPILYHRTSRWWTSQMGRYLMGSSVSLAVVMASGVVRLFFPDLPGQEAVRAVALTAVGFFVWYLVVIYIRVQRTQTRERTGP